VAMLGHREADATRPKSREKPPSRSLLRSLWVSIIEIWYKAVA